jgi:hypothetical protein
VARHLAPATRVIHEIRSEIVHVDIHVVAPAAERPFWFLFTTGMSALPMNVPYHMGLVPHAELSLRLPDRWQVDTERWKREPKWYWPIRELLSIARYPHRNRTWLGEGHTIASSDPPRPFDSTTSLAAMLILPSSLDDGDGECGAIDAEVATELLELWPLHADELEYKRLHGVGALLDRLDEACVTAILDPDRPSCVPRGSGPCDELTN